MKQKLAGLVLMLGMMMLVLSGLIGCESEDEIQGQVVMIGDSLLDMSGCIPGKKQIRKELAILSGHEYRSYDVSGAEFIGDGLYGTGHIPDQYDEARTEDPDIETVIMNGGGNDILLRFKICSDRNFGYECMDFIDNVTAESEKLIQEIVADGADILFVSYLTDSAFSMFTTAMVYGMASAEQMLAKYDGVNGVKVKFVDIRRFQERHPEIRWLCLTDHTHPTVDASVFLAEFIWDAMEENDMVR